MEFKKVRRASSSSLSVKSEPHQLTKVSFVPDIQLMMFGLGDCHSPLESTAVLVEEVVLSQILQILKNAEKVAKLHGKNVIQPEDICFLMKKNIPALKRFVTYLGVMDRKGILNKISRSNSSCLTTGSLDASELVFDDRSGRESLAWGKSRQKYCLKFLAKIGVPPSSLDSVEDPVRRKRNERADARALLSSPTTYEMYHAARCASFCKADLHFSKFMKWLETRGDVKEKLDSSILEILVYLAKETIACLIDMVLTLREEDSLRKDAVYTQAISPDEIREAIRRHRFQFYFNFNVMSRDVPSISSASHFIAF